MVLMEINEKKVNNRKYKSEQVTFWKINGNRKLWNMGGFPKI